MGGIIKVVDEQKKKIINLEEEIYRLKSNQKNS